MEGNGTARAVPPVKLRLRSESAREWLFPDAQKECDMVRYFLKAIIDNPGERHGNLRLALSHARILAFHLQALLPESEERDS